MKRASILLALTLASPAWAAWPNDVMLDGIDTWRGVAVLDQDQITADYHQVLQELGAAGVGEWLPSPRVRRVWKA